MISKDNNGCIKSLKTKGLIVYFVNSNKQGIYISNQYIDPETRTIKAKTNKYKEMSNDNHMSIKWNANLSEILFNNVNELSMGNELKIMILGVCNQWCMKWIPNCLIELIYMFVYEKIIIKDPTDDFKFFYNGFANVTINSVITCTRKIFDDVNNDGILSLFADSITNNGIISAKGCGKSREYQDFIDWSKYNKLYFGYSGSFFGGGGGGIIIIQCHTFINNGTINCDSEQGCSYGGGTILIVCKTFIHDGTITSKSGIPYFYGKLYIYCNNLIIKNGTVKAHTYINGSYKTGLKFLEKINKYPQMYINPICHEMDYTSQELKRQIFTQNDYKPYQKITLTWNDTLRQGIIIRNTKKYVRIHWIGYHKSNDVDITKTRIKHIRKNLSPGFLFY